jgi:hypothetical protein
VFNKGLIDGIIPINFACIITPTVPVIEIFNFLASDLSSKSLSLTRLPGVSNAKAIALAAQLRVSLFRINRLLKALPLH